jgi:hypothetical protein
MQFPIVLFSKFGHVLLSLFWLCEPTLQWNKRRAVSYGPGPIALASKTTDASMQAGLCGCDHFARTYTGGVARSQHEERSLIGRILPCKGGTKFCSYKKR